MTEEKKEAPQPLFYENPQPILKDRHAKAGVSKKESFEFTATTKTLPLNFPEFIEAAKHYPIAFTSNENPIPIAILGLEENNLYVNKKGEWENGTYIPAYARRYPFAFTVAAEGEKQQLILCVDESSKRYNENAKDDDAKFFSADGEQTEELKNILNFCEQYHADNERAQALSKRLDEMGLLKERRITINMGEGVPPAELHGFKTVDDEAFEKLDTKTLEEFHKNGILGLLHFQMMSNSNWNNLLERHMAAESKKK